MDTVKLKPVILDLWEERQQSDERPLDQNKLVNKFDFNIQFKTTLFETTLCHFPEQGGRK